MGSFRNELKHIVRRLMRAPMLTLVTLATIAIGVGANSAIFSVTKRRSPETACVSTARKAGKHPEDGARQPLARRLRLSGSVSLWGTHDCLHHANKP